MGKNNRNRNIAMSISLAVKNPSPLLGASQIINTEDKFTANSANVKPKGAKEPEWRHIEIDPSKLHTHCLMLSKIRLTCKLIKDNSIINLFLKRL